VNTSYIKYLLLLYFSLFTYFLAAWYAMQQLKQVGNKVSRNVHFPCLFSLLAVSFWKCNMNNVLSLYCGRTVFAELCVRSALDSFLLFTQIFNFSLVFHFTSVFYVVSSSTFPFCQRIQSRTHKPPLEFATHHITGFINGSRPAA